jgi:hypothetical protein
MIRYTLKCDNGHQFDSWFQSGDAFEKLIANRMTECVVCGSFEVSKALMAPRLTSREHEKTVAPPTPPKTDSAVAPAQPMSLSQPDSPLERAVARLRAEVEKNSDYVGSRFAQEARRMHEGTAPTRAIHGEARLEEARALAEDGVPVIPLPFTPRGKVN